MVIGMNKGIIYSILAGLLIALFVVFVLGATYLLVAGLTYLICLGFGWEWNWFLALGVWALCVLLRWIISAAKGKDK